ncbi:l-sorbosone dehydrogenase [Fusarium heterosporum]|uniref:L-sorbosone dehydrogenase n=1 Tax=Fusarium heterosporum TaxID=42747 RepID=A0A8H5T4E2_FUSHE|nr:l-sorbosone dehydrogenase [Fusarium heterosporum]
MASLLRIAATTFTSTFLLSLLSITSAQECKFKSLNTSYPAPVTAPNWEYSVIANKLRRPRGLVFDTEGALLVIDSGNGIVRFELEDGGGTCLQVKKKTTLLKKDNLNHAIALSRDGRTIYASSSNDVFAWPYDPYEDSLQNSLVQTLVTNMTSKGHTSRTLLVSQKYPDMLLVSRGSNGNDDEGTEDRDSGRSQLRAFNISSFSDNSSKKPYNYTDGEILGWGLRNSVGVAEHPKTGGIFSVENSADELHRDGTDIHKDNPAEEMNFHGFLNGSSEDQGGNYGYPLCYTLWSTEGFPNLGDLKIGDQFPADRQTGEENATSRTDKECKSDYVAPVLAFQAHTAPLDMKFDSDGTRAYISFHGSWNREPPVGYRISYADFENGQPAASSRSKKATTPIISNKDISKCPDECFRPVGLAWDPKGRLWFTSDKTGEIFVLNQTSTSDNGTSSGGDDDDDDDNSALSLRPGWAASIVTLAAVIMGGFLA